MIKVGFIINFIVQGGPSNVVINIMSNLDRTKYKPILITLIDENDANIVKKLKESGIEVIEFNEKRIVCLSFIGKRKLSKIIKDYEIDILHGHGFIPDIMISKINVIKISTIHNIMFEDYIYEYGKFRGQIYIYMHLLYLKKVDIVVGCSETVYMEMKKFLKNATFIRNGITNTLKYSTLTRQQLDIPENALVFIYVGRLNSRKNVLSLVKNFSKYHKENEFLLILGDGPELEICRKINDNTIKYLGFKTNTVDYMSIADIYTSFSYTEGFSISILEAMMCGLGLFVSDIGSHAEIINIDKNLYLGELFNNINFPIQLEKLRKNLYKIDRMKIRQYQNNTLSANSMVREYQKLYSQCIKVNGELRKL